MSRLRARRVRRRSSRWLVVALAALGALWIAGLYRFVQEIPDQTPPPAAEAGTRTDAIVVLTGGAGRVTEGLGLLEKGRARKLFVSGVYRGVDVRALLRLARRAPGNLECCIVLGYAADDTVGNARETARWMRREGYASLRLVTASYHMPRALLAFRRLLPEARIVPHPVFPPGFRDTDWRLWPGTAGLLVREYHKYLLARAGIAELMSGGL